MDLDEVSWPSHAYMAIALHLPVEKETATDSSILAYRILWTEEPGGLLSMGSHWVRYDCGNLACMHALEREMATHSNILVWRIPGTEEPDGLPSMGSHRVGHDWSNAAAVAASPPWGRHCNRNFFFNLMNECLVYFTDRDPERRYSYPPISVVLRVSDYLICQ